ncbi:hypothetical protein [Deinococcus hopiensis]|nr:hypothetical protein [Deinococcus hopiensis]
MKALRAPLLTLLTLTSGGGFSPTSAASAPARPPLPSGWTGKLAALVPLPGQSAQLLERSSRVAFPRLQQRVMTVGGSREALYELFSSVARGELPKYDERLKISREEFGSYMVFQPILVSTGKLVKLSLTRSGNVLRFGNAAGLPGLLRDVTLDLGSGELRTPEGFGARPRAVDGSNAPDRSIDIRGGFEWNVRGNDPVTQNGINGQLQLLQLPDKVVLIYTRFSMLRGTTSNGTVILGYTR